MIGQWCKIKPDLFCQEREGCKGCQVWYDSLKAELEQFMEKHNEHTAE